MEKSLPASDLEGRKRVRVRLRPNLIFTTAQYAGETHHTVKDPVHLRYYQLDDRQRFVVSLMNGTHTLGQIQEEFEERFRPERLSLEELECFVSELLSGGLVQNESPQAGRLLFERARQHRRAVVQSRLLNFLYVQLPLWNPDPWLDRFVPPLRFLFRWQWLLLSLCPMLAALGLLITHWDEAATRLPAVRDFFTFPTLLYLWLSLGLVKLLHELGHALCCKALGGNVPEMGVLLLAFCPSLYCDATDSWMLTARWRRIAVSSAGIYVELLVASLATFVWWTTDAAGLLHHLSLAIMVVASVHTILFNANPLMRFDGYYVLSDWLGIPNLAEQSGRLLRATVLRWLGASVPLEIRPSRVRRAALVGYAVASYIYRLVVLTGILYLAYTFLAPHKLGALACILAVAAGGAVIGWPLLRLCRSVYGRRRLPDVRLARLGIAGAILLVAGAVAVLLPLPMSVQGVALIQVDPEQVQRVTVPEAGGFLSQILVQDGQLVRGGEIVAVLTNPDLEIQLRVNEADQALRAEQKSAQLTELTDARVAEELAAGGLQLTEFELRALVRQHATLREQQDRLTLRAPCDGVVLGLRSVEEKGNYLVEGTEICRIGDSRALRAVLLVDPADRELVVAGSPAWVRIHGGGLRRVPGVVTEIAQVEAKQIPPQLSSRVGGEVPTRLDPSARAERPFAQHYLSSVRLQGTDIALHPGTTGRVKIETAAQTLWWRCRRFLAANFNWGL
jgi:putative peptide zinc metalloprotease protein